MNRLHETFLLFLEVPVRRESYPHVTRWLDTVANHDVFAAAVDKLRLKIGGVVRGRRSSPPPFLTHELSKFHATLKRLGDSRVLTVPRFGRERSCGRRCVLPDTHRRSSGHAPQPRARVCAGGLLHREERWYVAGFERPCVLASVKKKEVGWGGG